MRTRGWLCGRQAVRGQGRSAARWVLQRESVGWDPYGAATQTPGPQASGLMNGISSKPATCSHVWTIDCETRGGFTWQQLFLRLSHGFPRGQQVGGWNWPQNLPVASCYNHPPAPILSYRGLCLTPGLQAQPVWKEAGSGLGGVAHGKHVPNRWTDRWAGPLCHGQVGWASRKLVFRRWMVSSSSPGGVS